MAAKLKDVAERAGVSVRTVSNVVNNAPSVAEGTRARVLRVIEELQYRPNLAARNLRQGRTGLIGLAVPEIRSPYFGELAELLIDAAQDRGWTVILDRTDGSAERERRLVEGAERHTVDGMIISPWALTPEELVRRSATLPLVVLGEQEAEGTADHVTIDNVTAAREATAHLLALGRRRVAAVGLQPQLRNGTAEQRARGYREALAAAGLAEDPSLTRTVTTLHREEGYRAMRELLLSDRQPDAVFCFSDELALGALRAVWEHGLAAPSEVAVVGFDDIEDGRYATPALSTVSPDKRQIADRALQCLADRIYGRLENLPARRITIPHRLLTRESSTERKTP
ncbi:LacI family transcriptional regulator [Streptomyces tubbatahanensis]|uniref:LacI family transcriptional regulator n=1 Tax=Streptomyces tubbatahanensis TaxID=2923272 RepID=A0ABY3Y2M4_9ACTN|nr:LacI family DNA-binding transcriptional regulator [Streptomyces tubbatahanensis]UNT00855.1 LacI family transcriptional regulator [Streptomyces tubbatahanensis]